MNYLELRKKYVLYRYVAIVLAIICILCTDWMIKNITIKIICILLVNVLLFFVMLFIKKNYIRAGNKLLHTNLDLYLGDNILNRIKSHIDQSCRWMLP